MGRDVAALGGGRLFLTDRDIDALTWAFMNSEEADDAYSGWSLDQRIERFLRHRGLLRIVDDGDLYSIFVDRVLTYIGAAQREARREDPRNN